MQTANAGVRRDVAEAVVRVLAAEGHSVIFKIEEARLDMVDQIKNWMTLLKNRWWGSGLVYLLIAIAAYSTIWAVIEPLDVPTRIALWNNDIDRRLAHITISLLISAHLTLLLDLYIRWHKQDENTETDSYDSGLISAIDDEMISAFAAQSLCPERKELIIDRVAVKDGKMREEQFAKKVLWSLHCNKINERAAHELLREFSFDVQQRKRGVFELVKKPEK